MHYGSRRDKRTKQAGDNDPVEEDYEFPRRLRCQLSSLKNDFGRAFLEEQVEEVYSQDFRTVSGVLFDFRRTELVVEEQEDEKMSSRLMLLDVYLEVVEDLFFEEYYDLGDSVFHRDKLVEEETDLLKSVSQLVVV